MLELRAEDRTRRRELFHVDGAPLPVARHGRRAGSRRDGAPAPHVRDDVAPEARAAHAGEPPRVRAQRRHDARARSRRTSCLNVMPLFHIHGLVAAVLASLVAGGSVVVHPGLRPAPSRRHRSARSEPTWTTAVPTMLPVAARRTRREPGVVRRPRAPLRPLVVCVATGPAARRRSRSARRPGGRGVRDDRGGAPDGEQPAAAGRARAGLGRPGGRARRSRSSTRTASSCPPAMSARSRSAARTSSTATRRTRRRTRRRSRTVVPYRRRGMARRGRLSASSRPASRRSSIAAARRSRRSEVDEVLAAPPGGRAGRDIRAAARASRRGRRCRSRARRGRVRQRAELQIFAGESLAPFKVPRRIVTVDEIPKGATGKLQRIGLAQALGLIGD